MITDTIKIRLWIMPPPRTRFVIECKGQISEIFSVEERKIGDLGIYIKRSEDLELNNDGNYIPLIEYRISVHVSPNAPGHTFTHHNSLSDGRHLICSTYVIPQDDVLMWKLLSHASADLSHKIYKYDNKSNDELISLGSYDPSKEVLVYHLIISSIGVDFSHLFGFQYTYKEYKSFQINVLWGFMKSTTINQGSIVLVMTSQMKVDGVPQPGPTFPDVLSPNLERIERMLHDARRSLSASHRFKLKRKLDPELEEPLNTGPMGKTVYLASQMYCSHSTTSHVIGGDDIWYDINPADLKNL
ncbi:hypothetical protein J2X65_005416 [Ancylobacter sp. 3268]|uniref:hypothetical protein n=1 Tax=Ancylobacter sp. 3268 TaxID=2817752 RepID=UPI00285CF905|nr:hypothetical protein [Ancylobacter sp. 3268]MDR6956022.1 hypothetical protein [Ancylobacter sp. 3268]